MNSIKIEKASIFLIPCVISPVILSKSLLSPERLIILQFLSNYRIPNTKDETEAEHSLHFILSIEQENELW